MIRALAVLMFAAGLGLLWSRMASASVPGDDYVEPAGEIGVRFWWPGPAAVVENPQPIFPDLTLSFDAFTGATDIMSDEQKNANLAAFLLMIRTAEGTAGPNGYRTLFGGGLIDSLADHPRRAVTAKLGGRSITSTAAGAYQALAGTWDDFIRSVGARDFSPASQDEFALWCLKRRGALADVLEGRFVVAVGKVAKEWASLPGSPYGQPTISETRARDLYASAGGAFA